MNNSFINLSITEFKKICDDLLLREYVYTSDNQAWHSVSHTLAIELSFTTMTIIFNPNIIYLKNNNNILQLKRVKRIKMSNKMSVLGRVFIVICGDSHSNGNDTAYTIIGR